MLTRQMKESGVEWIGKIPEDWNLSTIGTHYKQRNEKVSDLDFAPLSVTKGGIVPQLDSAAKSSNHNDRKLVKKDDFVINSRSDRKMSSGIAFEDGSVSLINTVLFSKSITKEYTKYILKNASFAEEFYRWGTGIVADLWSTKWEKMKKISIPVPSLDEQVKIALKLDEVTNNIDSIISDTKQSIAELKKYKQSLIIEVITKGLDKNVEMKDSGVYWIGETPNHYKILKIKYISGINRGRFNHRPRNDERFYNGEYPFIQTGDVANSEFTIEKYTQTLNELGKQVSQEFKKGTIMMTIAANVGDVAILNYDAYAPDSIVGFYPHKGVNSKYLLYLLQAMKEDLVLSAISSTQMNLNIEIIKERYIPFTDSEEEQSEIVNFLDKQIRYVNSLINQKKQLIFEFDNYKKSLIYEYVTGKKHI